MRILLVEDDPMIGKAMVHALRDAAYAVDWVQEGLSVPAVLGEGAHQIVLLDLGLPDVDGAALLPRIRALCPNISVLVLTARDGVNDRVIGLDLGADDYVVKPFATDELLARLRAVIRRRGGESASLLDNGVVSLDVASHKATRGDITVALTRREFSVLQALMLNSGGIMTREALENHLYGWDEGVESNAVAVIIHSIRRKLGQDVIRNIRGVGWLVAAP